MTLDLLRLDDALIGITNEYRTGNLDAIGILVKIVARRAAMLGYDAALRIKHEGDPSHPIELSIAAPILAHLGDDELEKLEELLRKARPTADE